MIAASQLAQLYSPGMQPCSATTVEHACARCQDQTSALHMFYDTNGSESCLVKASAKHASESVLVVGELLCTGVQANTERHTRKETREMCSFGDTNNNNNNNETLINNDTINKNQPDVVWGASSTGLRRKGDHNFIQRFWYGDMLEDLTECALWYSASCDTMNTSGLLAHSSQTSEECSHCTSHPRNTIASLKSMLLSPETHTSLHT